MTEDIVIFEKVADDLNCLCRPIDLIILEAKENVIVSVKRHQSLRKEAYDLDCLYMPMDLVVSEAKKTVIVFEMIIARTLSPLKDERRGLWVL